MCVVGYHHFYHGLCIITSVAGHPITRNLPVEDILSVAVPMHRHQHRAKCNASSPPLGWTSAQDPRRCNETLRQ